MVIFATRAAGVVEKARALEVRTERKRGLSLRGAMAVVVVQVVDVDLVALVYELWRRSGLVRWVRV